VKKTRFTEAQIVAILRELDAGVPAAEQRESTISKVRGDGYPKVMPLFEARLGGFGVIERTLRGSVG
jgi:hypothetical protein